MSFGNRLQCQTDLLDWIQFSHLQRNTQDGLPLVVLEEEFLTKYPCWKKFTGTRSKLRHCLEDNCKLQLRQWRLSAAEREALPPFFNRNKKTLQITNLEFADDSPLLASNVWLWSKLTKTIPENTAQKNTKDKEPEIDTSQMRMTDVVTPTETAVWPPASMELQEVEVHEPTHTEHDEEDWREKMEDTILEEEEDSTDDYYPCSSEDSESEDDQCCTENKPVRSILQSATHLA